MINSLLEISVHEVNKITSPISLEEHLKWSDIVIATSGLTKYEILRSGTPSIIVPHNELQFELNKSSAKTKAFLTISSSSIISELSEALENLIKDNKRREEMSIMGLSLLDGNGISRIFSRINK